MEPNYNTINMRKTLAAYDSREIGPWVEDCKKTLTTVYELGVDMEPLVIECPLEFETYVGMNSIAVSAVVLERYSRISYDRLLEMARGSDNHWIGNDLELGVEWRFNRTIKGVPCHVRLTVYAKVPDDDVTTLRLLGKIRDNVIPARVEQYVACDV